MAPPPSLVVPGASVAAAAVPSVVSSATASVTPSVTPSATASQYAVRITSVANFRDVAGKGLEVAGGGEMSLGVVYRSARLTGLSGSDSRELAKAGVSCAR